jgi:hypothetical protein
VNDSTYWPRISAASLSNIAGNVSTGSPKNIVPPVSPAIPNSAFFLSRAPAGGTTT